MCYLLGPLILHLGYTPLLFCGYLYFIGTPRLTYGHEQGQYGTLTERITYVFYYNNNTAIYKQYTTYIYCWSTLRTRLLCTSSVVHCKRIHRHLITALFGGQPTISPSCKQQATSGKFFRWQSWSYRYNYHATLLVSVLVIVGLFVSQLHYRFRIAYDQQSFVLLSWSCSSYL